MFFVYLFLELVERDTIPVVHIASKLEDAEKMTIDPLLGNTESTEGIQRNSTG